MPRISKGLLAAAVYLTGCVTVTPEAQSVMVYSQNSTLIQNCKRLGPVSIKLPFAMKSSMDAAVEQVVNNARDEAYRKYHADTLVLTNTTRGTFVVSAEGMAMRCDPTPGQGTADPNAASTSAQIGCPPQEITITDLKDRETVATWTASCRSHTFYCTQANQRDPVCKEGLASP